MRWLIRAASPILAILSLSPFSPATGWGQACSDYSAVPRTLGGIPVTNTDDLDVLGNVACGIHASGFYTVDVTDPNQPVLASSIPYWLFSPREIAMRGDFAYASTPHDGFVTIDVSDPYQAALVDTTDPGLWLEDLTISGSILLATDIYGVFRLYNLEASSDSALISTLGPFSGGIQGIGVSGALAFLGLSPSGLAIVDISDPYSPSVVGTLPMDPAPKWFSVAGNYLYALTGAGLHIIDISTPATPIQITFVAISLPCNLDVQGDYAFITERDGCRILNVRDPESPWWYQARVPTGSSSWPLGLKVVGDKIYTGSYTAFQIHTFPDPPWPEEGGSLTTSSSPVAITISGDLAFLADYDLGLVTVGIANPTAPIFLGSVGVGGSAENVEVSGNHAFVVDWLSMAVVDVSIPTEPTIITTMDTPGNPCGITLTPSTAYVADYQAGLQIVDIMDPATPYISGTIDTPGSASDVAIRGGIAYVADGAAGLAIIDVATRQILGTASVPYAIAVATVSDFVFVGTYQGFYSVDVSDPAAPVVYGPVVSNAYAKGIVISGDFAYLTTDYSMHVVDVSEPTAMVSIGYIYPYVYPNHANLLVEPRDLAASGDWLFVACASGGLAVMHRQCGDSVAVGIPHASQPLMMLRNAPNPFSLTTRILYELASPTRVQLGIYDVSGRLVRTVLGDSPQEGGRHEEVWNGLDDEGRQLPDGVYIYRLKAGDYRRSGKTTLVN